MPLFDAIASIGDRIFSIVDQMVTDKDQAARLKHELQKALAELNQAQIAVNKQEAKHGSIFVAGWRPFIGWVCGVALAWEFVGAPVAQWALTMAGLELTYTVPTVPEEALMELVMAMLGMAGLRSFEKRSGVARAKMKPGEEG